MELVFKILVEVTLVGENITKRWVRLLPSRFALLCLLLRGDVRLDQRLLKEVLPVRNHDLLVGQDKLRVEARNRLGRYAVDILLYLRVVALFVFAHELDARWFSEHRLKEVTHVHLGLASHDAPVAWVRSEVVSLRVPALFFVVEVRAVALDTLALGRLALLSFIVQVMVLELFPAMAVAAAVLERTTIAVRLCLELRSPHGALRVAVVEDVHLAPEVLPVVRVHTVVPRVGLVTVGTPCSLEMEDVEI